MNRFPTSLALGWTRWVLLPCLLAIAPSRAHDGEHPAPVRVPDAELHRPSAMPDRIVLTWTSDPATSQAVTWRTWTPTTRALAQLAVAADGPQKASKEVMATREELSTDLGIAAYHTAEFQGLEPDTLYAYRIGDGVNWSEWLHFRTAKDTAAPFTFLYFGDAQNDIRTHWSRVVREAFREAPRAAFTLHAGDLINTARRDADWGEWFGAPAWVNATIPVVPTPGNHEYFTRKGTPPEVRLWETATNGTLVLNLARTTHTNTSGAVTGAVLVATRPGHPEARLRVDAEDRVLEADAAVADWTGHPLPRILGRPLATAPLFDRAAVPPTRLLTEHWRPQFALPLNGPEGLEESVYYLDYQGTRIISLNSNERQETQAAWLRSVLGSNTNRWTILTFHHPLFSPAQKRDNPKLRALWKPILDQYRVDLILTGHDHTYARTGDNGLHAMVGVTNVPSGYQQAYDPEIGTVQVVSVSGPKMYTQGTNLWAVRRAEDTQLFQVITVEADRLRYEARTATGTLYDAFTLEKRAGRPNRLVEVLPREHRRPPPPPAPAAGKP